MPRGAAKDPLEAVQAKLRAFDRIVDIVKGLQPRRVRAPRVKVDEQDDEPPKPKLVSARRKRRASSGDDMPDLPEE